MANSVIEEVEKQNSQNRILDTKTVAKSAQDRIMLIKETDHRKACVRRLRMIWIRLNNIIMRNCWTKQISKKGSF